MSNSQTVYVVEDDEQSRKSICALASSMTLRTEPFASAEEFLDRYVPGGSGCLVTDMRMQGMSGLELQAELTRQRIRLPVIVVTAYAHTAATVQAMKAGAITLLEKPYADNELWEAIHSALAQDAAQRTEQDHREQVRHRIAQLTPSERQVMELVVQGKPNKQIAAELELSVRTVEKRRHNVFCKVNVSCAAELARVVVEAGETF